MKSEKLEKYAMIKSKRKKWKGRCNKEQSINKKNLFETFLLALKYVSYLKRLILFEPVMNIVLSKFLEWVTYIIFQGLCPSILLHKDIVILTFNLGLNLCPACFRVCRGKVGVKSCSWARWMTPPVHFLKMALINEYEHFPIHKEC